MINKISYKQDGTTLFYVDESGNEFSASPGQEEKYYSFLDFLGRQQQAERVNNSSLNDYLGKLHAFQLLIDSGRLNNEPAPKKPLQLIVSLTNSNGVTAATDLQVPFTNLPDPIFPSTTSASTSLRANVPDIQLNLLLNINKKLDQLTLLLQNGH